MLEAEGRGIAPPSLDQRRQEGATSGSIEDRAIAGAGLGRGAHLEEGCEVGGDSVDLLGAAEGDSEAGHHLVEDQESAVLGCESA